MWVVLPLEFGKVVTLLSTLLKELFYYKITCAAFYKYCVKRLEPSWNQVLSLPSLQPVESGGARGWSSLGGGGNVPKETPKAAEHIQEVSRASYLGKAQYYWNSSWEPSCGRMKCYYTPSYLPHTTWMRDNIYKGIIWWLIILVKLCGEACLACQTFIVITGF